MGGVLPTHPQRVLGIGGTAGMVHPSTGFMVSRMLGAAPQLADSIVEQLSSPADKAADAGARLNAAEGRRCRCCSVLFHQTGAGSGRACASCKRPQLQRPCTLQLL